MTYPTVALSIRQPWAWAIINLGKDIENRSWKTNFRGPVFIHAAKGMTNREWDEAMEFIDEAFPVSLAWKLGRRFSAIHSKDARRGGIVGMAEIVDCVTASDSPWFAGPYGFVLRNPKPLEFTPCRGALGFFKPAINPADLRPLVNDWNEDHATDTCPLCGEEGESQ